MSLDDFWIGSDQRSSLHSHATNHLSFYRSIHVINWEIVFCMELEKDKGSVNLRFLSLG